MIDIFGLYVILTDPVIGYEKCAEAAVKAGVKYLQLRIKQGDLTNVVKKAKAIRKITLRSKTLFIVNDDVRIAAEACADGVHLGQEDMDLDQARTFWNEPGKIYGLSTHNEEQAARAIKKKPDYIGVGPVFVTPTKEKPDPVLGLSRMKSIIRETTLTTVAIGGISLENVGDVLLSGALNFCAVRAIMHADDPYKVIQKFQSVWEECVEIGKKTGRVTEDQKK